jgi:hypothetical protein
MDAPHDALVEVRRVIQRTWRRRLLVANVDGWLEPGILLAWQAVERDSTSAP